MAKFIAISGPSATGKTSLVNELSHHTELKNAVFLPDPFSTIWNELVSNNYFSEYEDISRDPEYLCVFILRVIEKYAEFIKSYENKEKLVILDSCWIDIATYSLINMWYTHTLKDIQERILKDLCEYDDRILKVYITTFDESKKNLDKYRIPFKRYNVKNNRLLELKYYELSSHLDNTSILPSSDTSESSLYIIEDLKNLGYL